MVSLACTHPSTTSHSPHKLDNPHNIATYYTRASTRAQVSVRYPDADNRYHQNLCQAALTFTYDTLKTGGHFLCKFYQGSEDHALELRLRKLFEKVHRIKPESSRKESKEAYLLGLRRKAGVHRRDALGVEEAGAIDESE